MRISEYIEFVSAGSSGLAQDTAELLAGLGISDEAGEVAGIVKKAVLLKSKPLDEDHLCEELGDVLWYLVLACIRFKIPFDQVVSENMKKLVKRHPGQYSGKNLDDWLIRLGDLDDETKDK